MFKDQYDNREAYLLGYFDKMDWHSKKKIYSLTKDKWGKR